MIRIPKKILFAVEAVLDVAYNGGGEPVHSGGIAERQGIPRRYLEQALQQLVHAGILTSIRGPRGGYRLARERRQTSLGDIIRAIGDGGDEEEAATASDLGRLVVRPLWAELQQDFMARLDAITLDDLTREAREQGIPRPGAEAPDWTI